MNTVLNMLKERIALLLGSCRAVIVIGSYWGDEGKGKCIGLIASLFDLVIRFSGGANAGHTVYTEDGIKVVSHLIPCGIDKDNYIGAGVFLDIDSYRQEYETTTAIIGKKPRVFIDRGCSVKTPWHSLLESWQELCRGAKKVGTTGRAIGPIAETRASRSGIFVADLFRPKKELKRDLTYLYDTLEPQFVALRAKLERQSEMDGKRRYEDLIKATKNFAIPSPEKVTKDLMAKASFIKSHVADTSVLIGQAYERGMKLLLEASQAPGLDIDWGTGQYVSSGHSNASGAEVGTGVAAVSEAIRIMVMKLFPTRVGFGPFPSEIWTRKLAERFALRHAELFEEGPARVRFLIKKLARINAGLASLAELAQYLQVLGFERGATTLRGRSVGFLDLAWMHYAIRINGPDFLSLTRLDMGSGLKRIPVVVGYKHEGKLLPDGCIPFPKYLGEVEPVIEYWDGWDEDISGCNDVEKLVPKAKKFVLDVQSRLGVPMFMLGTGPGRDHAIIGPFD